MKIESQKYNDIIVLQLQGEFTAEALKAFEDAASNAIASRVSGIVLDMSRLVLSTVRPSNTFWTSAKNAGAYPPVQNRRAG
jgi:hypothetical protein